jgi:hypothetical protein
MHGSIVWAYTCDMCFHARTAPSDVRAPPDRRDIQNNSLSGTLPKEWSAMTAMTSLYGTPWARYVACRGTPAWWGLWMHPVAGRSTPLAVV